jgi:hypothetical protein
MTKYEFQNIDFQASMTFTVSNEHLGQPGQHLRSREDKRIATDRSLLNALALMRNVVDKVGCHENKILYREGGFYEQQIANKASAPPDLPEKYYTDWLSTEVNDGGWEIVHVHYADSSKKYPKILFKRRV